MRARFKPLHACGRLPPLSRSGLNQNACGIRVLPASCVARRGQHSLPPPPGVNCRPGVNLASDRSSNSRIFSRSLETCRVETSSSRHPPAVIVIQGPADCTRGELYTSFLARGSGSLPPTGRVSLAAQPDSVRSRLRSKGLTTVPVSELASD